MMFHISYLITKENKATMVPQETKETKAVMRG